MEACLVMINNLKRVFRNKVTYLIMILIPILLTGVGMVGNGTFEKTIRVGLLHPTEELQEQLEGNDCVEYRIASMENVQTEYIMGTYQYVIDGNHIEEAQEILSQIKQESRHSKHADALSPLERFIAMLMTAYLVIATVYASKFIQDREQGMLGRAQTAGVSRGQYLLGYALSTALIVVIQMGIAVICFWLLRQEANMEIGKMFVVVIAASILATVYALLHVSFCKREMTANIMASSIAVLLSILGGTFVTVGQMPMILQRISVISPIRWILDLL